MACRPLSARPLPTARGLSCAERARLARDVRLLSASLARLPNAVRDGADDDLSAVFGRIAQLLGD